MQPSLLHEAAPGSLNEDRVASRRIHQRILLCMISMSAAKLDAGKQERQRLTQQELFECPDDVPVSAPPLDPEVLRQGFGAVPILPLGSPDVDVETWMAD